MTDKLSQQQIEEILNGGWIRVDLLKKHPELSAEMDKRAKQE